MIYQNENFGYEYDYKCRWHDVYIVYEHLHEFSELLLCRKGNAEVYIKGRPYTLRENELVFILPNTPHRYNCVDCEVVCAVFSNDYIPLFFHELSGRALVTSAVDMSGLEYITDRLEALVGGSKISICGALNLICDRVLSTASFDGEGEELDGKLYQKVISYVSEHYTHNITLKSLAQQFGYNEKYLSSSLHSLTGINFRKLLSSYRISHAKRLLEGGEESISDIAYASGFSAVNTFNRIFKQTEGVTPLEYRARMRK